MSLCRRCIQRVRASRFRPRHTRMCSANISGLQPQPKRHAIGFTGALDVQNLIDAMRKRGFSDDEIVKFLGGNFLRVIKEVWK